MIFINLLLIGGLVGLSYKLYQSKSENRSLHRYKNIKDIIEVSAQDKNVRKSIIKINSILLDIFEMDFSSVFIMDSSNNLKLIDSNVMNTKLRKRLKSIKDYEAVEKEDFKKAFSEDLVTVRIKSENPMSYILDDSRQIRSAILVPLLSTDTLIGYWLIEDQRTGYIDQVDAHELIVISNIISIILENGLNLYLDPMLKIAKRDFFYEYLEEAYQDSNNFAIGFLDIDHFKQVNDQHGHQVGDEVLKFVARTITDAIRDDDIVARFGGEEILIGLNDISREQALVRFNDIRQKIADILISINDKTTLEITVSIGLAMSDEVHNSDELIKLADDRVYIAKRNGRNQVCHKGR